MSPLLGELSGTGDPGRGRPVVVPTRVEDGFQPDPDAWQRPSPHGRGRSSSDSPSNPTRAVLPRENLQALAAVVAVHPDVLVITDDIYERLLYTGRPFINVPGIAPALRSRTMVVNGMSKAYAMTGWRMGYAAGPKALIAGMQLVQDQATSNVNSITQRAALAALTGPQEPIQAMVKEFHQRRSLLHRADPRSGRSLRAAGGCVLCLPGRERLGGQELEGEDPRLGPRHLRAAPGRSPGGRRARRAVRGTRAPPVLLRRLTGHAGEGAAALRDFAAALS